MAVHLTSLPDRAVLEIKGPDAVPFLQGLVTNDVTKVSPATPAWAALLSPQGKYLFDFLLFANEGGDGFLLDAEAGRAEMLAKRLTMYRLRAHVEITPRRDLAVYAAWGDGPMPENAVADPRLPALGTRWIAAPGLEATATPEDYDHHRLALGVPDGSRDIAVDKMLWLEANAAELNGVDFRKGCYVGQENTARMYHRSKVRKRLLPVRLSAEPGEDPTLRTPDGKDAGELRSHRDGLGLAFLRMEYVEQRSPLVLGGTPVEVVTPVWLPEVPDAGA
ncbi:CAF17-like 4Fe-4S cluster assembly/insertion protein YgfZ [Pedomonas mirosovicensis]|uniref:CAF17-like 4Fe-4S cluster assembly/insertion protein YgfZ n=1 Tax=Pedomonas mirosovicensis TaxID=2908641 RepID=UPI00216AA327|nr:folate-binding protein [Pedomonas mirosovicensis]MCH8684645.1 folate-binding protein [Pedomonas mirosovicensis]